jgi:pentapeptide repeat protein
VQEDRINTFQKVDFTGADLRQTAYVSAGFVSCLFKNTRLNKVNFQGSTFMDCSFEGELREVCFNRKGFGADALPPNEMLRVDFSRAQLRSVEFRGLDLGDVYFPTDPDHILLNEYPQTLDRLLQSLRGRTDMASKKLAAAIGVDRKWAGPRQRRGILNKNDLLEIGGEDGLRVVLGMIESHRS